MVCARKEKNVLGAGTPSQRCVTSHCGHFDPDLVKTLKVTNHFATFLSKVFPFYSTYNSLPTYMVSCKFVTISL
jgi:hypothetical protein